jgi:acyl-CoA synthetase (AMP-forming)/AMP-acid ligase II
VTPASAAFSAAELEYQLRASGAKSVFTCTPLLPVALEAAEKVGISRDAIILLPVPGYAYKPGFTTLDDLLALGKTLPENEPLQWIKGQGARQVAYMCFSSGTSGLPVSCSHPPENDWMLWTKTAAQDLY